MKSIYSDCDRVGPIRLQRDAFGLWPADNFWTVWCKWRDAPEPSEEPCELADEGLDPARMWPMSSASPWRPVRQAAVDFYERLRGLHSHY